MDRLAQSDLKARSGVIRIGTRGSPLALAQAHETRRRLMEAHGLPETQFEIVKIVTTGDRVLGRPLAEIGGKGLFTQEIEDALHEESIDLAVHSMKDVPTALPVGLEMAALLPREDPRDAFISLTSPSLLTLPQEALLGSSSLRRNAQALRLRSDLKPVQFRGNVQTRLRKLEEGVAAATFLAVAGLNRLGLSHLITKPMEMEEMLPAVAQGAIGIEIKTRNDRARKLIAPLHDNTTGIAVDCERAFLTELEGSCRTPIAGHATVSGKTLFFRGQVLAVDGSSSQDVELSGHVDDAAQLGTEAARKIRTQFCPPFSQACL